MTGSGVGSYFKRECPSTEPFERSARPSLNTGPPARRGRVLCCAQEISSQRIVTGGGACSEHAPPEELGLGEEELRTDALAHRGGPGEGGVGLVVAAEDGRQPSQVVAH